MTNSKCLLILLKSLAIPPASCDRLRSVATQHLRSTPPSHDTPSHDTMASRSHPVGLSDLSGSDSECEPDFGAGKGSPKSRVAEPSLRSLQHKVAMKFNGLLGGLSKDLLALASKAPEGSPLDEAAKNPENATTIFAMYLTTPPDDSKVKRLNLVNARLRRRLKQASAAGSSRSAAPSYDAEVSPALIKHAQNTVEEISEEKKMGYFVELLRSFKKCDTLTFGQFIEAFFAANKLLTASAIEHQAIEGDLDRATKTIESDRADFKARLDRTHEAHEYTVKMHKRRAEAAEAVAMSTADFVAEFGKMLRTPRRGGPALRHGAPARARRAPLLLDGVPPTAEVDEPTVLRLRDAAVTTTRKKNRVRKVGAPRRVAPRAPVVLSDETPDLSEAVAAAEALAADSEDSDDSDDSDNEYDE